MQSILLSKLHYFNDSSATDRVKFDDIDNNVILMTVSIADYGCVL